MYSRMSQFYKSMMKLCPFCGDMGSSSMDSTMGSNGGGNIPSAHMMGSTKSAPGMSKYHMMGPVATVDMPEDQKVMKEFIRLREMVEQDKKETRRHQMEELRKQKQQKEQVEMDTARAISKLFAAQEKVVHDKIMREEQARADAKHAKGEWSDGEDGWPEAEVALYEDQLAGLKEAISRKEMMLQASKERLKNRQACFAAIQRGIELTNQIREQRKNSQADDSDDLFPF